jgi:translocation and assembly module TamB
MHHGLVQIPALMISMARCGIKEFNVNFEGQPRQGRIEARELTFTAVESPLALGLVGSFGIGKNLPRIALAGNWQKLSWPLGESIPVLRSPQGRFTVIDQGIGADKVYVLSAEARLQPRLGPPIDAQATGMLSSQRLNIERANLNTLGGQIRLAGRLQRGPRPSLAITGRMQNINPESLWEHLPGKLNADFALQVAGFGLQDIWQLELQQLSGTLRGASAAGAGTARFNRAGSLAQFQQLQLSAGGLSIALDGVIDRERRDLDFGINADDLSVFGAKGRGQLRAQGQVRGSPESMKVGLSANAKEIAVADLSIERLVAQVDIDPVSGASAPAQANIDIKGLRLAGADIAEFNFRMRGQAIQHEMEMNLSTNQGLGLRGRGNGVFLGNQWRQDWQQLDLDLPAEISLALGELLSLRLTTDSLVVDPFCLRGRNNDAVTGQATLCGSGEWRQGLWKAQSEVQGLPLGSVLPKPSSRIDYDGIFNALIDINGGGEQALNGSLAGQFERAALRRQRLNGREEILKLGSGSLRINADDSGLDGELEITAGNTGRALGILRAERRNAEQAWRDLPLRATLQADSSALALLYLYVPEIDRSSGELLADLVVGGTLGAPSVSGVLRLSQGELDFYQVNLALRDITAEARLLENAFVLNSTARSGDGRIEANARLDWQNQEPFGEVKIRGENLLLVDLPEARLSASPDLLFKVDGRSLQASGTVRIPQARLTPTDLTGAVTASSDERLIDAEPVDPESTFAVSSDLRLILGDDVSLESFGLSGRLRGDISIQSAPATPTRAAGELRVSEGRYAALGRQLDIERGRLQFSGGLLNDPAIDVRAVKVFPDVKAGVNVRGTLREPRLTFFSEPSLPQSQVVSLILAGGGLESTQGGDPNKAGRDALLAQGSAILAQQLGQRIGIEDVGIEQNLSNETSLVFGKYLSSRLYISYGISLAETINTLKMRYSINDRWTLRTEASKETSAEIVYTVEKN